MIPAIGYADANQSHFTSRHYWEVGEVNPFGRIGWLGRYLDKHGVDDNPLQGLSLDWNLAPALAADRQAGRRRLLARVLLARRPRRLGRHHPRPAWSKG